MVERADEYFARGAMPGPTTRNVLRELGEDVRIKER